MPGDDKVNILVVDDLPDKLLAMELVLQGPGLKVVKAESGREALRRLLEQDFALILLDVNMPDMDGFETAELIRQRQRSAHTPIIFVTAFGDEMYAARGYQLGAVDYILSPVIPEVLRTKVSVFVDLFRKNEQIQHQAEERVSLAREQAARVAAEEETRRSRFLAEATTALANSLDLEATVRNLLCLVVPRLAKVAVVTMAADQSTPWRSSAAWASSAPEQVMSRQLTATEILDAALGGAVGRVLATGVAETMSGLDALHPAEPEDNGVPSLRFHVAVVLPLQARGRTLGAFTLLRGGTDTSFLPADLALAEDLAGRAAIAIDNARLYRDIQEADRHKNEFLAMLAHELRNPLAPICNAVRVLQLPAGDEPTRAWACAVIERQTKQMVRLVDDLLDVSRITRGKITLQMNNVDVTAPAATAVEASRPLVESRRQELTVSLPREPLRVRADPARLAQVLANLLNNASKYTPEGGRIWLTVAAEQHDAVFKVRDTGVGIPSSMLPRIFDLFTQVDQSLDRSQGGLGIGLTLVRRLIEMHGGRVEVHSEGPDKGSEFVVRVPKLAEAPHCLPDHSGQDGKEAHDAPNSAPSWRTLVVDDNVDAAESLATLLRLAGHEVRTAHDGVIALEVAEEFRPEIVLLDIGLPRLDGYEVARRLRQDADLAGIHIVCLSGYGQVEDRQRSHEAGVDHHLVKPVSFDVLQGLFTSLQTQGRNGTKQAASPNDRPCESTVA